MYLKINRPRILMDIFSKKATASLGLCLSMLTASQPGDTLVMEAVNAFYNYETAEAITMLDSARIEYPDNPLAHFTWVAAHMLHSEANNPTRETYRIINQSLDTVIPTLKMLEKKRDNQHLILLYTPQDPVQKVHSYHLEA